MKIFLRPMLHNILRKVHYDLDEKLSDIEYYDLAMKDCFESVFHKVKEGWAAVIMLKIMRYW